MKACLEALLELGFCTKPPNFGVEAQMEAPTGVALRALQTQFRISHSHEAVQNR
jgi:hypothetical protein